MICTSNPGLNMLSIVEEETRRAIQEDELE